MPRTALFMLKAGEASRCVPRCWNLTLYSDWLGDIDWFCWEESQGSVQFAGFIFPHKEQSTAQAERRSSLCELMSGIMFPCRKGGASGLPV